MTAIHAPAAMHKVHDGLSYTILLKPDDTTVYLDINELGLHHHQVRTVCEKNDWDHLEEEGDHAAFTIIDLHNAAPKVFL
ncbi:hypothetical protein GCM10011613_02700 [Cellvibrio zantedeschiae]|uniref:Uncharacterized protein n=1 Tax=Cellvibrio zantedeschiae TaxID=1237077 RepID=A0ABQ3AQZ6_9GAMM|nr:hypothetical protein [Cellvibrio zantedeschiae]GGY62650.1 hypothetical protein GCM10011613_02700 [Cellvibrio zantedeschiae]